jgi:GH15 family glucan-1,4-alpha-glucosidase
VALDRLIRLHERGWLKAPIGDFRAERDVIRNEIESRGYNQGIGSYTRLFDGDDLDASLLTLPLYGYIEATQPRMRSTLEQIRQRLAEGELVYRYHSLTNDGLPPGEGAFGICSFWAVECLALAGDLETASTAFAALLRHSNDLGLYAEEVDPASGAALGNFPQAFTHVGLINAALTLSEASPAPQSRDPAGSRR